LEKFMKHLSRNSLRAVGALALTLSASLAQAHTGHGTHSLLEGLTHPLGADHLLAMVAVGIWSVSALPAHRAWWGPAAFMLSLIVSACLGVSGVSIPFLEPAIALSVVAFGALLVLSRQNLPTAVGLGLVAGAAALHGLAHGAEAPASGFGGYAVGFLLTTAALHIGGVVAGLNIRRRLAERSAMALTTLGGAFGAAGLYLFSQI
jgi:urease accessory protein